jgi:cobaltochelatase CobN
MSPEEAGRFSRARIFSEAPGTYGIRVANVVASSGMWDDQKILGETYRKHISYAYGEELWGEAANLSLDANLKDTELVYHSSSSNLYGLMDNDDMFMFLGGLSMATREVSGKVPMTLILEQKKPGEAKIEDLAKQLGREMRSRYFNPKWIEGMMAEDYAGAREMQDFVEYLWGWDATVPEAVDESHWDETYRVYVEDKYDQGIAEFMEKANPFAYQNITARMLETARKGYWDPSVEIKTNLAKTYVESALRNGLSCGVNTCQNPLLHTLIHNLVSVPGVLSPEDVEAFKELVEKTAGMSLEEMTSLREELIREQNQERNDQNPASQTPSDTPQSEAVRGLKMEKVEDNIPQAESSGAEEWLLPIFALSLIVIFFIGYKLKGRGKEKK